MKRTHRVDLYRQRGEPSPGEPPGDPYATDGAVGDWVRVAVGVPCTIDFLTGDVKDVVSGQLIEGAARVYVHPRELPEGIDIAPGDGVLVIEGRSPSPRFAVVSAAPRGPRTGRYSDEIVLERTAELFG